MLPRLLVIDDAVPRGAALNMAIDEALLEAARSPTLRFYHWEQPAISFGYFGAFADLPASEREVVRRWTGGGMVPHGDDITYSLVLPENERRPAEIYAQVHEAIRGIFANATLASDNAPRVSDACFANPARYDVLLDGHKIAGAAQRRTRCGLLQQGSVQHAKLPADFRRQFAAALCPEFEPTALPAGVLDRAHDLACEKYATADWLRRR